MVQLQCGLVLMVVRTAGAGELGPRRLRLVELDRLEVSSIFQSSTSTRFSRMGIEAPGESLATHPAAEMTRSWHPAVSIR